MARQSVEQLQVTFIVPRGDAGFWKIIRELDAAGTWTWRDVDQRSNVHERSVRDFVKRLELGGFAERVHQGTTGSGPRATTYRLLQSPIEVPRIDRQGKVYPESRRQRLWRAIRMVKTFTAAELRELAATDEAVVSKSEAHRFLQALVGAGIVQAHGQTATSLRIYRLLRDLGPLAPVISTANVVFDPNSKAVVGTPLLEQTP